MSVIKITVDDQNLHITDSPKIAAQGVNENYVGFTFSADWDGFGKTAIFYNESDPETVYTSLVDGNGLALIPHEITESEGRISLGLSGVKDDVVKTSEILTYKIVKGLYVAESSEPSPGIYEQMLSIVGAIQSDQGAFFAEIEADQAAFKSEVEESIAGVEASIEEFETEANASIDVIDARVDNLVADVRGAESTTIWSGNMSADGGSYTLSQDVSNFDFLDIFYDNVNTGVTHYLRIPANKAAANIYVPYFETDVTPKPLEVGKVSLSFSGTSVTVSAAKQYFWDGTFTNAPTILNAQHSFPVRIDGVKTASNVNAELADIRVGADGTTYASAGAAVRGQIGNINDKLKLSHYDITWSQGGINSSGVGVNRTNRIRSDYISIESDSISVVIPAGYKYAIHAYDSSKQHLGFIPSTSEVITAEQATYKVSDSYTNAVYFRIWVAYSDDSNILPSVGSDVIVSPFIDEITALKTDLSNLQKKAATKTIKILGVGNSYTRDSTRWLWKILKDSGYDNVIIGHGYWGASTLADQYESLTSTSENHSVYEYWKYSESQNAVKTSGKSLDEIFADEPWDVVIFQQQSDESGQYASYVSANFDINNFITYISGKVNNANVKFGLMMPWSHANGYSGSKFAEYYNSDPAVMFNAIKTVIPQVANHMSQCDYVINAGIAIDNGRTNAYLGALGDQMLRVDKNHLYYGIPSFMIGMVYAVTISGIDPSDIIWYPTATDEGQSDITTSAYLAFLAKQCAFNASHYFM